MSRKRMIDPCIWASEDFGKLSTLAKIVWVGLFSNADDDGRGRGKVCYIKSILFPYDEQEITVKKVDKALDEIAEIMSIVFYEDSGSEYYQLTNWKRFQSIEKPQISKIPPKNEQSRIIRGTVGEQSGNDTRLVVPKRKEENIREEKGIEDKEKGVADAPIRHNFVKPNVKEIMAYCFERQNGIDAEQFIAFYDSKGWKIGNQKMTNWKSAIITWEKRKQQNPKPQTQTSNPFLNAMLKGGAK